MTTGFFCVCLGAIIQVLDSFTMHKFYWNNTHSNRGATTSSTSSSASANGSGGGNAGAGSCLTAGSTSGVKIADNQLSQQQQQQLQSSSDFPSVNNMHQQREHQQALLKHPEVPIRANGGTATIRFVHHVQ